MLKFFIVVTLLLPVFSYAQKPKWVTVNESLFSKISSVFKGKKSLQTLQGTSILEMSDAEILKLSDNLHSQLHRCGGFMAHDSLEDAKHALKSDGTAILSTKLKFTDYDLNQEDLVREAMGEVEEIRIREMVQRLSAFKTRHYQSATGIEALNLIQTEWKELTKNRSDITVESFKHKGFSQPSVILTILGSTSPEEIVILGAHADSISSTHLSPGADDNASGIATLTENLRILMQKDFKPARTIQLMAYAAEEVGLLGSGEIAKLYKKQKRRVVGVLQLDMTLFRGTEHQDIVLIKDYTNKNQNVFLGNLIDKYLQIPWGYSECGYGCSDHASWTQAGYPASFSFESSYDDHNPYIHSPKDTLENAGGSADHAVNFAKLALSFLIELSL
jgi:bacterial leucyl aminopeptidase